MAWSLTLPSLGGPQSWSQIYRKGTNEFLLRTFEAKTSGLPILRTLGSYLHMQAQILADPWVMVLRLLELL